MIDEWCHDVARARAHLTQCVQRRIALHECRVAQARHDHFHEFWYMRLYVLTAHAREFAEAHQHVRGDGGVCVVRLRQQYAQHWDRVRFDEPLRRADKQSQEARAFFPVPPTKK